MLIIVGFPLTVAISFALIALTNSEDLDAASGAIWLAPIAVYAAVAFRLWTLALPLVWSAVYLSVLRVVDLATGGCSVCGSDEDWGNYPAFFLLLVVIPMTLAVLVGLALVAAGRGVSRRRRR